MERAWRRDRGTLEAITAPHVQQPLSHVHSHQNMQLELLAFVLFYVFCGKSTQARLQLNGAKHFSQSIKTTPRLRVLFWFGTSNVVVSYLLSTPFVPRDPP